MQCIEQAEQESRMQISATDLFQYLTYAITQNSFLKGLKNYFSLPKLSSDCTLPALLNPWHWNDPPRSAWAFWMVRLEVLTRKPHCVMWKTARPCPLWEPLMTGVPCHVHWIEGSGLASTSHWSTTCHRSWGLTFDRTIRQTLFAWPFPSK